VLSGKPGESSGGGTSAPGPVLERQYAVSANVSRSESIGSASAGGTLDDCPRRRSWNGFPRRSSRSHAPRDHDEAGSRSALPAISRSALLSPWPTTKAGPIHFVLFAMPDRLPRSSQAARGATWIRWRNGPRNVANFYPYRTIAWCTILRLTGRPKSTLDVRSMDSVTSWGRR